MKENLKDIVAAQNHINKMLENGAIEDFIFALQSVSIAHGIPEIAKKIKISRENLYKVLYPYGNPSLVSINKIIQAIGFEFRLVALTNKVKEPQERLNSLEERYPEIAKQWHPTKNKHLAPRDVSFLSRKKVWWICRKGHEWELYIISAIKKLICPYCHALEIIEKLDKTTI